MNARATTIGLVAGVIAAGGCTHLAKAVGGGRIHVKAEIQLINDSPYDICVVKALKDGEIVETQALPGVRLPAGEKGALQVRDDLGEVELQVYSCAPEEALLKTEAVDVSAPHPVRVV